MLIELKSSATDPMNTPSRMLQRFKETLILKPNSRVALQSALITTNSESYAVLTGDWLNNADASHATSTITFTNVGANAYWKYKNTTEWWRPSTGNVWLIFEAEPINFSTLPTRTATMSIATNTITIQTNGNFLTREGSLTRKYLKNHVEHTLDDATILVNLTNFPINSRNVKGNTDNHIATIPYLTDLNDTTKEQQFYEPYNPTAHSLDNEADLNLNFIELELLNSDGTQRTDLIHPTQITLRITNEISSN